MHLADRWKPFLNDICRLDCRRDMQIDQARDVYFFSFHFQVLQSVTQTHRNHILALSIGFVGCKQEQKHPV